jgi:hypothetical protein
MRNKKYFTTSLDMYSTLPARADTVLSEDSIRKKSRKKKYPINIVAISDLFFVIW